MGGHNRKKLERHKTSKNNSQRKRVLLKHQAEQKVPNKLNELLGIKNMPIKKNKKANKRNNFRQIPGETEHQFLSRMNEEVNFLVKASRNIPDEEPEKEESKKKKKQRERQKLKNDEKKQKLKTKKENRAIDKLEKDVWKDEVKFGEVVLRPPEFKSKPRKSESIKNARTLNLSFMTKFSVDGKGFKKK